MESQSSPGITAIPVSPVPLEKVAPGPQETTDTLTQKARWTLIILLIVFPPFAWYLMATNKHYHKWFAYVILINGVIPLLVSIFFAIFYMPSLLSIHQSLGLEPPGYGNLMWGVGLSVICIVLGIYFKIAVKKQGSLTKTQMIFGVITVILSYILPAVSYMYSLMSVIIPTYTAISSIN
ncbi:MAG TPA: hypothetical protein PLD54_01540 [Candidatus Levybacteria bacterium]|nr:hypothetical protein [Candidatus Levybacteria bacterium]